MAEVCSHGVTAPAHCLACDDEAWALAQRKRRMAILAEDGAIFGLTAKESAELAQLEQEFGSSGLAEDMRS